MKKPFTFKRTKKKRGPSKYTKQQIDGALAELKEGKIHIVDCAQKYKMTYGALIYYISTRKIKLKPDQKRGTKEADRDRDNYCSCCGLRPKAPGNRFLCLTCYQTEE